MPVPRSYRRLAIFMAALSMTVLIAMSATGADEDMVMSSPRDGDLMWRFIQAEDAVNSNLTKIDLALADASTGLSISGLAGSGAEEILMNLTGIDPSAIDCITTASNGTILEVAPEEYMYIIGDDVGGREHMERLFSTKRPVGLAFFKTVEGFYAMDFEAPVFDNEGCIIGAASVLINSTDFFGRILKPYQPEAGAKIWIAQPDGLILYETDTTQIGQNPFKLTLFKEFPDLLALGKKMETDRTGYGTYEFFNEDHSAKIRKAVHWTTIGYHGSEIRLALTTELQ